MNLKTSEMGMLHAPLMGKLLLFTLPIALNSMVQQLFNAADTAVVGYFGSKSALAAVGTNTEIIALIVTLSSGLSIGANILIANRIGRNEAKELPAAVQTAMILAVLRGSGHALYPAVSTMLGTCAFRIVWICTVFRAHPTLPMLYHAFPLSWAATILLVNLGSLVISRSRRR